MCFLFGDYVIDAARRELRQGSEIVKVEPQVFDLLLYLIRNRDRVVTKDEVLSAVWPGRIVAESTLFSRIAAARHAVGDSGEQQRFIRTVARRGFRFVGAVAEESAKSATAKPDAAPLEMPVLRAAAPQQHVKFCKTPDHVNLAIATTGSGPPLVKTGNWLNHVEYDWHSPIWAPIFARLASGHRLVRYDGRGNGLSDWQVGNISFEAFVGDLEAVVDAAGLEKFALLGISQGASVAIAYATRHPERVSRLILCAGYASGWRKRGNSEEIARRSALQTLVRYGWGQDNPAFRQVFTSLFFPEATAEQITWFNELQRMTASPENADRILNVFGDIEVSELLPRVSVPTLVLHAQHDAMVPFEQGLRLARDIPGARFVPLHSRNHLVLAHEPAWQQLVEEIERFLGADGCLRTLLTRAHVLVAAGALLCAITPHGASGPIVLGIGRLATGIGAGGGIVTILVTALGAVPARERPFVGAVVWSGIGAAVTVCGFAAPLLLQSASGWRASFAAAAILALAISFFFPATGFPTNPAQAAASLEKPAAAAMRLDAAQLLTPRWSFLVATYLLFGVGYIAYATFAGVQLAAAHTQPSIVGLTWAAFGIATIVGAALVVPVLGATRIKEFALFGGMVSGSLGAFVLESSAGNTLGSAVLVGLGIAAIPTIVSTYARERCSAEDYAKAFSYASSALGIGQLVGPVAAGALADHFGMAAVPLFAASAYSIGGLLALCDAVAARSTAHRIGSAIL